MTVKIPNPYLFFFFFFYYFTLIGSEKNLTDDANSTKDGSWRLITQHTGLDVTFPWPVERAVRDLVQSLTKKHDQNTNTKKGNIEVSSLSYWYTAFFPSHWS